MSTATPAATMVFTTRKSPTIRCSAPSNSPPRSTIFPTARAAFCRPPSLGYSPPANPPPSSTFTRSSMSPRGSPSPPCSGASSPSPISAEGWRGPASCFPAVPSVACASPSPICRWRCSSLPLASPPSAPAPNPPPLSSPPPLWPARPPCSVPPVSSHGRGFPSATFSSASSSPRRSSRGSPTFAGA